MNPPYEGGCSCGAVRYRITGEPLAVYCCHCADCQVSSGGAFSMSMLVMRDHLEVIGEQPATYDHRIDGTDRTKRTRPCAVCGTRVWNEPAGAPAVVLKPGTLDDASWLRPVAHIWTRSAQPWVPLPDGPLNYPLQPGDGMMAIITAYQAMRQAVQA